MPNFPDTPTGAIANDIKILFDKFRSLRDEVAVGDLDVVTDRGATTTNSITVGASVHMQNGSNVAELRLTTAGKIEIYVNGTIRQSI